MGTEETGGEFEALRHGLGAAIRARRTGLAHSQESLAAQAGISRVYLGDVERGERNPSLLHLLGISRALGTPVSQLLLEAEKHAGAG